MRKVAMAGKCQGFIVGPSQPDAMEISIWKGKKRSECADEFIGNLWRTNLRKPARIAKFYRRLAAACGAP